MFRLSCLLLSSIGLAVLYVTFKDHNKSGHFKPSPSLRPLSEQELVFLRKPKWSHFRARLKKLSYNKSRGKGSVLKRQMDSTVGRWMQLKWYMYYRQQKVIIWTEKKIQRTCIKLDVCLWFEMFTFSWLIEDVWIFTLVPECRKFLAVPFL